MKHPPCSVVAAATAILAVVLAIGGCSTEGDAGKASDTAATASNGDAAMLLKQATDAMRKVTGMHVRLAVTGDVPNLRVTKLEGDISNTPQTVATGSATLLVGNKSEDAKFVYVDGHLYSDLGQPHPQATGCASHVGHQPQQARRSRRPNHRPLGGVATLGRTREYPLLRV